MTAILDLEVRGRGIRENTRALLGLGGAADKAEGASRGLGVAAARMGGALAAAALAAVSIGQAISVISEFDSSMSRLGAVSRATGEDLAAMRDVARDLGATTEFSATQAADGLNFLAMAGFSASEAMASIPAVLDLATASGMGLAQAADTASNIMSGFGIEAENAANVSDVLAAASTRANTTVGQLGSAMSTVAPISSALGISLEDTAAAIGVLSDAGIQGERAGTAMRGVLASLAGPTTQAEEVLSRLGLTIADVNPETNEFADVMQLLGDAGLSTADAMTVFGREAASGALVLIDGAQRVAEFGDELRGAEGAATGMATAMRDNLGGDIQSAISAIQSLIISLGDAGLTAVLRAVVQGITSVIRAMGTAVDLASQYSGYFIAAATAITAYYLPSIVAGTIATGAWVGANALLIASLVTVKGALIATGIGAFVVLAGFAVNKFLELSDAAGGFGNALSIVKDLAIEVWGRIGLAMTDLRFRIEATWSSIQASVIGALAAIGDSVAPVANTIIGAFVGAYEGVVAAWSALPAAFARLATMAANNLVSGIEAGVNGVISSISSITSVIGLELAPVDLSGFIAEVGDAVDVMGAATAAAGEAFSRDYVGPVTSGLQEVADSHAAAAGIYSQMSDAARQAATAPLESLTVLNSALDESGEVVNEAAVEVDGLNAALNEIGGTSGGGGSAGSAAAAIQEATTYAEGLSEAFENARLSAADMGREMGNSVVSGIESVSNAFGDFVAGGLRDFDGFVNSVLSSFTSMLSDMIAQQARSGLMNMISPGGGGKSGGGGGFLSNLFAGFFDSGGFIPSGQFGVAGENGPELISGPARVTSTRDTAALMKSSNGAQRVEVDVNLGLPEGVTMEQVTQIAGNVAVNVMASGQRSASKAFPGRAAELQARGT